MELLPHAFLFRFAVPVPFVAALPRSGRWPVGAVAPLPLFSDLDSRTPAVTLRVGWNEKGLGVAAEISGKADPAYAHADAPEQGDGLHIWIDTRHTQTVHRAGKFCHRYALLPAVGRGRSIKPKLVAVPIARARDTATLADVAAVQLAVELTGDGYRLEAWFPAAALHGFDPAASPRLGFHAVLKDAELGDRPLTVGGDFPTDHDPSLWTTLDLLRD